MHSLTPALRVPPPPLLHLSLSVGGAPTPLLGRFTVLTGAQAVCSGSDLAFSCALRLDGAVSCWGEVGAACSFMLALIIPHVRPEPRQVMCVHGAASWVVLSCAVTEHLWQSWVEGHTHSRRQQQQPICWGECRSGRSQRNGDQLWWEARLRYFKHRRASVLGGQQRR